MKACVQAGGTASGLAQSDYELDPKNGAGSPAANFIQDEMSAF
jgi:hypothetical protein